MSAHAHAETAQTNAQTTRDRWPRVVVITGATASGKTSLAIEVAERLGAHIISADSRQIYHGMPVTTACPSPEERARVAHHLVEALDPEEYYSAARFEADALGLIDEARLRGDRHIVVCGGSMMYIDALTNGMDALPDISDNVRQRVTALRKEAGDAGLLALLEIHDPEYFESVDRANIKRVMHALEICMEAGVPYSTLLTGRKRERPFEIMKFAIDRPREELFDRINRRVEMMVASGMEEEARALYARRTLNSLNTVGLKEWFAYMDGVMDRETAIARIAKNTRVYAKKQLTWLRRDPTVVWVEPANGAETILSMV